MTITSVAQGNLRVNGTPAVRSRFADAHGCSARLEYKLRRLGVERAWPRRPDSARSLGALLPPDLPAPIELQLLKTRSAQFEGSSICG
jgi:hypothetical protein